MTFDRTRKREDLRASLSESTVLRRERRDHYRLYRSDILSTIKGERVRPERAEMLAQTSGDSFSPVSINFPSSTPPRFTFGSALGPDNTSLTVTWWEKPESLSGGSDYIWGNSNSNTGFRANSERLAGITYPRIVAYEDASNYVELDAATDQNLDLIVGEWNFVGYSIDMTGPTLLICVVNSDGVATSSLFDQTGSPTTISINSMTSGAIGSLQEASPNSTYLGDLAEIFVATGTGLVNFADATNRKKFISADGSSGRPVNLGVDGSTPFGTQPLVYFTGATADDWNNVGSAGAFTEVGTIAAGDVPLIPVSASAVPLTFDDTDFTFDDTDITWDQTVV